MKWLIFFAGLMTADRGAAQPVVSIIKEGITKVIRSVDLEVQQIGRAHV